MQSILHSLFNGRIIPWERREPRSKERLEVIRKIECEERYFIEKMSSDDCHRFQALSNLWFHTRLTTYVGRDESIGITLKRILRQERRSST
jgi:hypothetical protein